MTVEVWLDNKKILISDALRVGSRPLNVDVDLTDARFLELTIDDGNDVTTFASSSITSASRLLSLGPPAKPPTQPVRCP